MVAVQLAFGLPGLLELLIIGLFLGVPSLIAAIVVFLAMRRRTVIPPAVNPRLTPCPDCQQTVSRLAANCPHCGRPLPADGVAVEEEAPPSG